jgi:uncharacterized protein YoaH (UPF0181 family)
MDLTDARRMLWFVTLTHEQQREAIQRLSAQGMSVFDIAAATKLGTEQIRQILGQRPECEGRQE